MPDREKVIDWLHKVGEAIAKYVPTKEKDYLKLQQTVDIAIAWVRAQEPVKPIRTPETIRAEYNCGNCTGKVGIKFYDGFWYFKSQYCPGCGRKVKWDA